MPSLRSVSIEPLNQERVTKEYDISRIRELALTAIRHSIIIVDGSRDDQPIIFANRAFAELTGYSVEEVVGKNCRFMSGPDTSAETRAEIRAALAKRVPFEGMILNYHKDGTAFWNEISITPVDDDGGQFWIGVQNDVTERLELETRLRESQRLEAIGKLSGGIAHDFNNILALVLGNAEIIAEDAERGSLAAEAASDIIEAATGGSKLVTRMLQYARGEGGLREEVGVNAIVEDMVALLTRTIGDPVRLETNLSAAVGRVCVDRTLFETALLNLALNARDAMASGGIVKISTRRRSNAGPALGTVAIISVSDTGKGMDEATKARAFEPFFTTKHDGRGNGLGLAMVYNFVKQSGGDVLIESAPGRGTTVSMLLPIDEPTIRSVPAADRRPQILVVEDDPKVRKMLALHLDRGGYAVDEVESAEEALDALQGGLVPALLLSDIRLRDGMTGVELVMQLKSRDAAFPMLLMTGFSDELEKYADAIENVPVLRKPFRSADLLSKIDRAIERRTAAIS
jgi:PAS domain S-box-containing protein